MIGRDGLKITLKDKVALVTGGGGGIGWATAEAFSELGAKIVIAEIDPGRVAKAEAYFAKRRRPALVTRTDVRNADQVAACMAAIAKKFGKLDILVNNVGDFLGIGGRFETHTEEQWELLYDINLKQVFRVTKAALPLLRKSSGDRSIINFSTIEAFRGIPGCPVYSAFKSALTGFTMSLALDLGPEGIRVNGIAPETTDSLQVDTKSRVKPQHLDHIKRWTPLGRFGTPEDAAGCCVFLATSLSAWVTGTTMLLDGGSLAAAGYYRAPDGVWTHYPVVSENGLGPKVPGAAPPKPAKAIKAAPRRKAAR